MADLSDSSVFYGFTNEEIDYVSSDVWKIVPKLNSCSILIHHEETFDILESQVCSLYGSPQLMGNNGHIYRGDLSTVSGNNIGVTLTFYKTTLLVRVQGSGYAMFINKVLPTLAAKIQRNQVTTPSKSSQEDLCLSSHSTPCPRPRRIVTSTPGNLSEHCQLHKEFLQTVLQANEQRAIAEKENTMLKDRIAELNDQSTQLQSQLTEERTKLELMMARVAEVEVIEFESACNLKLLETTEARFAPGGGGGVLIGKVGTGMCGPDRVLFRALRFCNGPFFI